MQKFQKSIESNTVLEGDSQPGTYFYSICPLQPVNFSFSSEFLGDSSSESLSISSPTAKIVSPSSECRGAGAPSLIGFGGTGERAPLADCGGDRASSSSSDPPKDAISKPSSSCASCSFVRFCVLLPSIVCLPRRSLQSAYCSP